MKPQSAEADKFIDKRRKVHTVAELRREKMIVMRVGERRATEEQKTGQFETSSKKVIPVRR